ncbi:maltase A1-like [Periplaneta americana]|uniref:maltase A1-like n=1 Tax=Periplaneta americana TaxID=6978 RepID=UPI0037E76CEB
MNMLWMLISLAAFVAATPLPKADLEWWQTAVFYQIYPRSFKDSDGDGIGDLKGITENFDHLKDIGVDGVWLSPIFPSPMADFGYDISDFRNIDPIFGTLEDFDALLAKANELGIKLILDFVPNHSSDEHEWFVKSLQKIDPYTDYYTWNDGKLDESGNRVPPNNWQAEFGGPAWKWRDERQQYYLHRFDPKQPDLNYSNPAVVEEMKDVLRFWMDRGVDGFRVDAVPWLFEGPIDVPDSETVAPQNLPETYDMVVQWRKVLDEKSAELGKTEMFMLEVYGNTEQVMGYYGTPEAPGAHFPFNFRFITDLNNGSSAYDFSSVIYDYLSHMVDGRTPNWVLGNHDQHRVASRYGPELVDGMNFLGQLLPGIGVTYDGEEIGMENTYITWDQCRDPQGINAGPEHYLERTRDLERTPFQWDDTTSAGFSTNASTWLPVNPNYKELNLAAEKSAEKSHYKVYKQLIELRKTPTIRQGGTQVDALSEKVLTFARFLEGEDSYIVLVNLGDETETVNLKNTFDWLGDTVTIYAVNIQSQHMVGHVHSTTDFEIAPKEAFVFTTGTL